MKKTLSTITLATALLFGSTLANAGIIIAGAPAQDTTTTCTESDGTGIIIAGSAGIIIAGGSVIADATGIIIAGLVDEEPTPDCGGIIIAG